MINPLIYFFCTIFVFFSFNKNFPENIDNIGFIRDLLETDLFEYSKTASFKRFLLKHGFIYIDENYYKNLIHSFLNNYKFSVVKGEENVMLLEKVRNDFDFYVFSHHVLQKNDLSFFVIIFFEIIYTKYVCYNSNNFNLILFSVQNFGFLKDISNYIYIILVLALLEFLL